MPIPRERSSVQVNMQYVGALHVIELLLEDAISFVVDELAGSWPETARDQCTRHWNQFTIDLKNEGWSLIKPCLRKTDFRWAPPACFSTCSALDACGGCPSMLSA